MSEVIPQDMVSAHISWVDADKDDIAAVYAMLIDGRRVKITNNGVYVMRVDLDG